MSPVSLKRTDMKNLIGIQYFGFVNDIDTVLNMPIDMVTTNSLDKKFLESIQKEGEVLLYENKEQR